MTDASQSSARLAAEAAFGTTVVSSTPPVQPQVIFRKKRPCDPLSDTTSEPPAVAVVETARARRVFRLETHNDSIAKPLPALGETESVPGDHPGISPPAPRIAVRFRRSKSEDKLPKVIRHVVAIQQDGQSQFVDASEVVHPVSIGRVPTAQDERTAAEPIRSVAHGPNLSRSRAAQAHVTLLQQLENVRARFAREWHHLFKVAETIQADLDLLVAAQKESLRKKP